MRTTSLLAACLAFLALPAAAAAAPAAAQSKPKRAEPKKAEAAEVSAGFAGETVNVNVVNVDVYVTDKKGNRVTGLTQGDFEIFENKRPMAITNFFAMDAGKPIAPAPLPAAPAEPGAAPAVAEPAPAIGPAPEDQRLLLVVYVDNFNLRPFNRNRVLRELRVFLNNKLRKGDLMMLVSYDRSVHIRQSFTSDPGLIND